MISKINNEDLYKDLFKDFGCLEYFYDYANMVYNCDNIRIHYRNFDKIIRDNTISVDFGDVNVFTISDVPHIIDTTKFPLNVQCMFLHTLDDFRVFDGKNTRICNTNNMFKTKTEMNNRLLIDDCLSLTHIINVEAYDANVSIKCCQSLAQFSCNTHLKTLDITYCKSIKNFKNVKVSSVDDCCLTTTGIEDFSFCEDTLFGKLEIDCNTIKDYTKIENSRVINSLVLTSACLTSELRGLLRVLNVKTRDIKFSDVQLNEIFSKYFTKLKVGDRIEYIMDVLLDCHEAGIENICY